MAHWLLELNKSVANTAVTANTTNLTNAEAEIFGKLFSGTSTPEGNLFLWALAHKEALEANAKAMGLSVKIADRRIVWSAPNGHHYHSGSGRVARLKDTGTIALCYGSKVEGSVGLGGTKEKERRTKDLLSLWEEPLEAVAETPKPAKKAKKGKSIKK